MARGHVNTHKTLWLKICLCHHSHFSLWQTVLELYWRTYTQQVMGISKHQKAVNKIGISCVLSLCACHWWQQYSFCYDLHCILLCVFGECTFVNHYFFVPPFFFHHPYILFIYLLWPLLLHVWILIKNCHHVERHVLLELLPTTAHWSMHRCVCVCVCHCTKLMQGHFSLYI